MAKTRKLKMLLAGLLILAVAGIGYALIVADSLAAFTRVFSRVPEARTEIANRTLQPLADHSLIRWAGRDVARLSARRTLGDLEGPFASMTVYEGQWIDRHVESTDGLVARLISAEGSPPRVLLELVDSASTGGTPPIGQVWLGNDVLWLHERAFPE